MLLMVLVLTGGMSPSAHEVDERVVAFMSVDELYKLRSSPRRLTIVDVRSVEEFNDSRIKGAVNVPLTELERRFKEIPREGIVALY